MGDSELSRQSWLQRVRQEEKMKSLKTELREGTQLPRAAAEAAAPSGCLCRHS